MGYGILVVALASVIARASAQSSQTLYGQCGGSTYTGPTSCAAGSFCSTQGPYYAQCTPNAAATTTTMTTVASSGGGGGGGPSQTLYGQCGGTTYTGPTSCPTGAYCSTQGPYYAQCVSGTGTGGAPPVTTTSTTTSKPVTTTTTSKPVTTTSTTTSKPVTTTTTPPNPGLVSYAGVNIAGCDFGCDTSGNCNGGYVCPTSVGPTQMSHFTNDDHLNIFRLPVGWQYLVNNNVGGTLDPNFFSTYNGIVQACLNTGAKCIIDVHNYARYNGGIIGQGGPTNAQFANLWSQLASKYAGTSNIVFGIMNEPHDLDMTQWAASVQAAVTAIRNAGATSQWILLPGTGYTAASGFQTNSAPYLASVKNPDGSTKNLIYDIHQYMDSDGSGTHSDCVTDHVSDAFSPLATYLRQNGRQALLSETGGGNTQSCVQYVCSALTYLNSNSDVYLGWVGWAAGSFDTNYVLTETPNGSQDQLIVSQCIAGKF